MNKIIWAKKPGSLSSGISYNNESGFLFRCPKDVLLDNSITNVDTGIIIKPEQPICLLFGSYYPNIIVQNTFAIVRGQFNIRVDLQAREEAKIYKGSPLVWGVFLGLPAIDFKEVSHKRLSEKP